MPCRTSQRFRVLCWILLLALCLSGCQASVSTVVATPQVVRTCTLEGCGAGLILTFGGGAPLEYTLRLGEPGKARPEFVIYCALDRSTPLPEGASPLEWRIQTLAFDDPQVSSDPRLAQVARQCGAPQGYLRVVGRADGYIQSAWADCRERPGNALAENELACSLDTGSRGVIVLAWWPERLEVEVTVEGRSARQIFAPQYRLYRPNGPGCEPECRQAEVKVSLP